MYKQLCGIQVPKHALWSSQGKSEAVALQYFAYSSDCYLLALKKLK
jgi:hypothetical protein